MKKTFAFWILAVVAIAAGSAHSASGSVPSPKDLQSWFGTYACESPGNPHTTVITPALGGKIMRISGNGKGASEELAGFDRRHNVFVIEFFDVAGTYETYVGPVRGDDIYLSLAYPRGDAARLTVRRISATKYHTDFTSTVNGKTTTGFEDCTKR